MPASRATRRIMPGSGPTAARPERAGLHRVPQRLARMSPMPAHAERVCRVSNAQGRTSVPGIDQSARRDRRALCSTTIATPPAWIATMRMARSRWQNFPPAPQIRVSQKNVLGISASDGTTVLTPAVNQYENCLRCHGTSSGKQVPAELRIFPGAGGVGWRSAEPDSAVCGTATSSHPVMHDRSSALAQPSLLSEHAQHRWHHAGPRHGHADLLHGLPQQRRQSRVWRERAPTVRTDRPTRTFSSGDYEFSQAGSHRRTNHQLRFPNPDLSVQGPYAMCAKCHDLAQSDREATAVGTSTRSTSTLDSVARRATPPTGWAPGAARSLASGW